MYILMMYTRQPNELLYAVTVPFDVIVLEALLIARMTRIGHRKNIVGIPYYQRPLLQYLKIT